MTWCEYGKRGSRKEASNRRRRLIGVERYIAKVKAGCGSRSFKEWLSSKPMDPFVIIQRRVG
jgi:hypothetical protein